MSDEAEVPDSELPLDGAGGRLRRAREAAGLTLEQIAAKTRIPLRHLETIEANDFAALPSRTYALGFSRTYARAVDLNDEAIADQVRGHLAEAGDAAGSQRGVTFEPGDPARIPSRGLAWLSALAALLLIVGGFAFFRSYFIPGSGPPSLLGNDSPQQSAEAAEPANAAPKPDAPDPKGQVVFKSMGEGVWVRFYDSEGERLMEKEMALGETYAVPAAAKGPLLRTGQPEALSIQIGGKEIGTLSDKSEVVSDVDVSAAALLAAKAARASAAGNAPEE